MSETSYETLIVEIAERVATVTINRPGKLNALNARAKEELLSCFTALGSDPAVRSVILTGAGEKAFAAGTDIAELKGLDAARAKAFASGGQALMDTIERLGKPVIAAVNGYALGGGCELALACHIRLAAEGARFGQPEIRLGVIPGYGGTQRLARLVGKGRAMEMILTGTPIDAAGALRIGLVTGVFPRAELMARARAAATLLAAHPEVALRMALKAVNISGEAPLEEGLRLEASLFGVCCSSADAAEGIAAFLEKREPRFGFR